MIWRDERLVAAAVEAARAAGGEIAFSFFTEHAATLGVSAEDAQQTSVRCFDVFEIRMRRGAHVLSDDECAAVLRTLVAEPGHPDGKAVTVTYALKGSKKEATS